MADAAAETCSTGEPPSRQGLVASGLAAVAPALTHAAKGHLHAMTLQLALLRRTLVEAGDDITARRERWIEVLEQQSTALGRLVEGLLTQIQVNPRAASSVRPPRCELIAVLRAVMPLIEPLALTRRVELAGPSPGGGEVWVAAGRGEAARRSLAVLSRAVQATPSGGRLELRPATAGDDGVLELIATAPVTAGDRLEFRLALRLPRSIPAHADPGESA